MKKEEIADNPVFWQSYEDCLHSDTDRKYLMQFAAIPEFEGDPAPYKKWIVDNEYTYDKPPHEDCGDLVAVFKIRKRIKSFKDFCSSMVKMTPTEYEKRWGVDASDFVDCKYLHVYEGGLHLVEYDRKYNKYYCYLERDDWYSDCKMTMELRLYEFWRMENTREGEEADYNFHAIVKWLLALIKFTEAMAVHVDAWYELTDKLDETDFTAEHYPFRGSFEDEWAAVRSYLDHQLSLI